MSRIPKHFIDDLVDRADIVEVLGRRLQLKKAGKEYKARCPFHDEKTPSFTVSPAKGFYHCFGCGAHGTVISFLMDHDHMSYVEAIETLASMMGMEVPREQGQRPARRYDELFGLIREVERHFQNELRAYSPAVDYLKRRGIDGATAQRYGIGYAPAGWSNVLDRFGTSHEATERLHALGLVIRKDNGKHYDRFRDRIMFPIRDVRGRCLGFGGRVLGDEEPKYLNSPETVLFHKGRELYGLYEARQAMRNIERLVVVEGYMDVVGLARHGIDFAVATLGTATTDEHLNRLFRLGDEVLFCFDGDRAGRTAAWRALENALPQVREGRQIKFVFLPEGQDPDSFVQGHGAARFEMALAEATPLSDFLVDELASQVDLKSVDGLARLVELARPLVARLPRGVYRELLTKRLAETVDLSVRKLEAQLGLGQARTAGKRAAPGSTRLRSAATAGGSGQPSIVRRAITLLLQHPQTAGGLDATRLDDVDRPGTEILRELIEMLQVEPNMSTAALVERWRHREEGRHLARLAAAELPHGEEFDAGAELGDCLAQLEAAGARDRIKFLIEKERLSSLSEAERSELRALSAGGGMSG